MGFNRSREEWSRIRERGRTRFVWGNCVGTWGFMTAVLWMLAIWFWSGGRFPGYVWAAPIVFPTAGYLMGRWIWDTNERAHG